MKGTHCWLHTSVFPFIYIKLNREDIKRSQKKKSDITSRGKCYTNDEKIKTTPYQCFPCGAGGKEPACPGRRCKRSGFNPWVRKIAWRRAWQPTPVFLPGESHGERSLAGYSPRGHKESDTTARLSTHARMMYQWEQCCVNQDTCHQNQPKNTQKWPQVKRLKVWKSPYPKKM